MIVTSRKEVVDKSKEDEELAAFVSSIKEHEDTVIINYFVKFVSKTKSILVVDHNRAD